VVVGERYGVDTGISESSAVSARTVAAGLAPRADARPGRSAESTEIDRNADVDPAPAPAARRRASSARPIERSLDQKATTGTMGTSGSAADGDGESEGEAASAVHPGA
jgi:hypothetical protein